MVRRGGKSTVRGARYESTSIAAVYGTDYSLSVRIMGVAQTLVREYPKIGNFFFKFEIPNTLLGEALSPIKCADGWVL